MIRITYSNIKSNTCLAIHSKSMAFFAGETGKSSPVDVMAEHQKKRGPAVKKREGLPVTELISVSSTLEIYFALRASFTSA